MTDTLVRGMGMFEVCNDQNGHWGCPLFGSVMPYGYFCKVNKREITSPFAHQPWCPLVHVKKHGRLIDADALISVLKLSLENPVGFNGGRADTFAIRRTIELLELSPTIIQAEDGET